MRVRKLNSALPCQSLSAPCCLHFLSTYSQPLLKQMTSFHGGTLQRALKALLVLVSRLTAVLRRPAFLRALLLRLAYLALLYVPKKYMNEGLWAALRSILRLFCIQSGSRYDSETMKFQLYPCIPTRWGLCLCWGVSKVKCDKSRAKSNKSLKITKTLGNYCGDSSQWHQSPPSGRTWTHDSLVSELWSRVVRTFRCMIAWCPRHTNPFGQPKWNSTGQQGTMRLARLGNFKLSTHEPPSLYGMILLHQLCSGSCPLGMLCRIAMPGLHVQSSRKLEWHHVQRAIGPGRLCQDSAAQSCCGGRSGARSSCWLAVKELNLIS